MARNRLLKDNTSLEAVTLIEENDNEVFKLLTYEYISSIYHRHIEHFFHIFGGSTVFSLISESTRRL